MAQQERGGKKEQERETGVTLPIAENDKRQLMLLHSYFAIHQAQLCGRVLAGMYNWVS